MTTSGDRLAGGLIPLRRHSRWSALLLPLLAADTYLLFHSYLSLVAAAATLALALLVPQLTAKLAPFALFAYGTFGLLIAQAFAASAGADPGQMPGVTAAWWRATIDQRVIYGLVKVGPFDNGGYVLPQAMIVLAAGVWLLAVTDAPGGRAVRCAWAQLRGTNGQPKTVPPLLLLPVIFLWEELFRREIWFGSLQWDRRRPRWRCCSGPRVSRRSFGGHAWPRQRP